MSRESSRRQLRLFNSLTRSLDVFEPAHGRQVKWYNCGPTVYDHSHMGHARSYITFDIIRRVLQDYFGYQIFFVENVTDIDDKIIRRSRQRHLFSKYIKSVEDGKLSLEQIRSNIAEAVVLFKNKLANETDPDKKGLYEKTLASANESLKNTSFSPIDLTSGCKDILCDWLDKKDGAGITDLSIFTQLAKEFEDEYNSDMRALKILPPSAVSRVSEYVPEIVQFIEKIIDNGYAYESNASVYFDVAAFIAADGKKHKYAKLFHEAVGNLSALNEGEGDLTDQSTEKKNATDFALWKKSKPGEPKWSSPWGEGRPGWHIECSVMASHLLGETFDIHSGGIDLKFPHHDNEIAQSEAYYNKGEEWVKCFLHSGHLTISGCKMSKSLKNFITIKEALKSITCRQLRFLFLLHPWQDTLNYSSNTLADAFSYEKKIFEFFLTIKDIIRSRSSIEGKSVSIFSKWTSDDSHLNEELVKCRDRVDEALCNNIDTKSVLHALKDLINSTNIYIKSCTLCNLKLLQDTANFVSYVMKVFGLIDNNSREVNFDQSTSSTSTGESLMEAGNLEDHVMPYLQVLADFRARIRALGISSKNGAILTTCDELRDDILPGLGVRFEDPDSGAPTCIKLVDKETLLKERAEKVRLEQQKMAEKLRRKKEIEEKEAKNRMDPVDWAKLEYPRDKYSAFDDTGLPTHELDGKAVSEKQRKKMMKAYETQKRRHTDYQKQMQSNA